MRYLSKIWDWKTFADFCNEDEHVILGLMSGTSADGLDIANVKFRLNGKEITYEILDATSIEYGRDFQKRIIDAYSKETSNVEYITKLNFEIAKQHAHMIKKLNWEYDFIAYHGQTVHHLPSFGATLQIGEPDVLSVVLEKPVIHGFRTKDMALGGQGAPISAYFDAYFLLKDIKTVVLNVGGISNITSFTKDGQLIAFDTGPGNCLIDEVCQRFFGERYDKDGTLSSKGYVEEKILEKLISKSYEYIQKTPPKTTGREVFNFDFITDILNYTSKENLLRTLVKYTASMIVINLKRYLSDVNKIIIFGGGAYNKTLVKDLIDFGYSVEIPDDTLINFREAIAIAFLGELFLRGQVFEKTVTGAQRPSLLGKLSLPV